MSIFAFKIKVEQTFTREDVFPCAQLVSNHKQIITATVLLCKRKASHQLQCGNYVTIDTSTDIYINLYCINVNPSCYNVYCFFLQNEEKHLTGLLKMSKGIHENLMG